MLKVKLLTMVVLMSAILTVMAWRDSHATPWCGPDVISGPFSNVTWEEFTCPPNAFVTGIGANGGNNVKGISVTCSKVTRSAPFLSRLNSDEGGYRVIGRNASSIPTSSNDKHARAFCPEGSAVIGLHTYCGNYVDSIRQAICYKYNPHGGTFPNDHRGGFTREYINVGGLGGKPKFLNCPDGEAIYKVKVARGEWIDLLEVFCKKPPRQRPDIRKLRPPTARDLEQFKQR